MIAHTLVGTMHRPWQRLYDWLRGTEKLACCVCGRNVEAFVPLPDSFLQVLRDAGWPYGFDRLETLNVARYQCPHCGANDRDRLCALYLDEILASWQRAVTIVQFAPAKTLTDYIRRTMAARRLGDSYRTADLYAEGVDDRADIADLSCYASASVDLFLCSHVLEHVADDRRAMRELRRILRPGGRGMLLVPVVLGIKEIDEDPTLTDVRERWRRFAQDDHLRLYSKCGFVQRLQEAGFAVHQLGCAHFGQQRFAHYAIRQQSVLYVVE